MNEQPAEKQQAKPTKLDRFGTLNGFVDSGKGGGGLADLTKQYGPATPLVWFTLFRMASGKTGTVRMASVLRLVALTGLSKNTVKAALKALKDGGHIEIAEQNPGGVPVYLLNHRPKG